MVWNLTSAVKPLITCCYCAIWCVTQFQFRARGLPGRAEHLGFKTRFKLSFCAAFVIRTENHFPFGEGNGALTYLPYEFNIRPRTQSKDLMLNWQRTLSNSHQGEQMLLKWTRGGVTICDLSPHDSNKNGKQRKHSFYPLQLNLSVTIAFYHSACMYLYSCLQNIFLCHLHRMHKTQANSNKDRIYITWFSLVIYYLSYTILKV